MKLVSLFTGIGGFERGLDFAGLEYKPVFASEIDIAAQKTYLSNYKPELLVGDITKIKEEEVPNHDFLVGGFPCQAFSIAGMRKGFDDARGTLFFDVLRILKHHKPKFFLLENVKNLVNHDGSNTIRVILNCLANLKDYSIDFSVINAKEAGAPQNRERTYIVGVKDGIREKYETDLHSSKINALKIELNKKKFPSFNFFNSLKFRNDQKYIKDIISTNVDEYFYLSGEKVKKFLSKNIFKEEQKCQPKIIKLFDIPKEVHNDLERQRRVYSIYGISPTVLARSDTTKIYVTRNGKRAIRKFTPTENFRIQGYDDSFIENIIQKSGNSNTQLYKQAGNAVSPLVIAGIVTHLFKTNSVGRSIWCSKPLKFIDLFSGLGGFRLAFEACGGKCVFSSDIDKATRETYRENFGEEPSGDITKIEAKDIPDFDVLCAGFPCQPFSLAGKRRGFEDTRGTLFFDVIRIIKEKHPKAFFLENVSGLTNHDNGNTIQVIMNSLDEAGYYAKYKLLNAKDYGVPQNRNRWYCVGVRKDLSAEEEFIKFNFYPEKCKLKYTLDDIIQDKADASYNSSVIAIKNIKKFLGEAEKELLRSNKILLANNVRPSRTFFSKNGVCPCLTAKMGTGGNNVPIVVNYMRKLTEKECLQIMGFPASYKIRKNYSQTYKQVGNSVIVPILSVIASKLTDFINSK